ncbi:hypothetical protein BDV06DRAFT_80652 [Aspergillus oleicola]
MAQISFRTFIVLQDIPAQSSYITLLIWASGMILWHSVQSLLCALKRLHQQLGTLKPKDGAPDSGLLRKPSPRPKSSTGVLYLHTYSFSGEWRRHILASLMRVLSYRRCLFQQSG